MLEDINNILNSGDIPNLYKTEDFEGIFKVGKTICMEKNIPLSKMNMMSAYLGIVKQNMHMIVAMSPLSESFNGRLRMFPSLVNNCTIDWFSEWPEEALLGVGRGQITSEDMQLENDLDGCVEMFKRIHQSVERKSLEFTEQLNRKNYVTPTSFLELLNLYKSILKNKRKEITGSRNRLVKGLEVLEKAAIEIAKLKDEIDKMAPDLEKTKKEVEETVEIIKRDSADADVEKEIVAKDEAEARAQEAEASTLKADAEQELSKATPLLEEATKVLKELKADDFYIISSIKNPTPAVVLGMEVSCHMMGLKPKKAN
jgi:dynein heavy chain